MAALLSDPQPMWIEEDPNEYRVGYVASSDPDRPHRVALTSMPHDNTRNAAVSCTNMLRTFPGIRCVVVTGVAGGVPSPTHPGRHVRLGDVVVPVDGVVDYGHIRQGPGGAEPRRSLGNPATDLVRAVRRLQVRLLEGEPVPWERWFAPARGQPMSPFRRPPDKEDVLHIGNLVVRHPPLNRTGHTRGQPKIHLGRIGSADVLLRDEHLRDELAERHGIVAFEMEGAGAAASAAGHGVEWFMVRGVVDYCNGHKNDRWHPYASLVAAGYLRGILGECRPFPARRTAPRSGVIAVLADSDVDRIKALLAEIPEPDVRAIWRAAMIDLVPLPESPPADLAALFTRLTERNADPDGIPPALALAEGAAAFAERHLAARIHDAIDEAAGPAHYGELLRTRRTALSRQTAKADVDGPPESSRPCVVIQIERDGIDHSQCELTYWIQRSSRWAPEPADPLRTGFDRIEHAVQDAIREAEKKWRTVDGQVEVEVLLPIELLPMDVEWWWTNLDAPEPNPLCLGYPVVVRSLDRMRASHRHRVWCNRWRALWRPPAQHHLFWGRLRTGGRAIPLTLWDAQLQGDPQITTVTLGSEPTSPDGDGELRHALNAGVPVILWDRRTPLADEVVNLVEEFRRGNPRYLVDRIRQLRREAATTHPEQRAGHAGRHLALLWDDPTRLVDGRPSA